MQYAYSSPFVLALIKGNRSLYSCLYFWIRLAAVPLILTDFLPRQITNHKVYGTSKHVLCMGTLCIYGALAAIANACMLICACKRIEIILTRFASASIYVRKCYVRKHISECTWRAATRCHCTYISVHAARTLRNAIRSALDRINAMYGKPNSPKSERSVF